MARQMVNFAYLIGDRATGDAVVVDPAYAVADLVDLRRGGRHEARSACWARTITPTTSGGRWRGGALRASAPCCSRGCRCRCTCKGEEVPWVERTTGVGASHLVGHDSGDVVRVGAIEMELIHTPGHTPGSQCFLGRRSTRGRRHPLPRGLRPHRPPRGPTRSPCTTPSTTGLARVPDDAVLFPGHCTRPTRRRAWGTRAGRTTCSGPARSGVDDHVRRAMTPTGAAARRDGHRGRCVVGRIGGPSRRCAPKGSRASITLVGEELHLPYDRPPLSKQVLAGTWPPEKAVLADRRRAGELQLHEVLGHRAVRLDAEKRQVEIDDGTVLSGDALVLATGAAPRHLPGTEGLSARRRAVHSAHAGRLGGAAGGRDRRRVVPGRRDRCRIHRGRGGLDLRRLGCRVTGDRGDGDSVVQRVGPADRRALCLLVRGQRSESATGRGVAGIRRVRGSSGTSGLIVETGDGERVEADVVVVGIGVAPAVDWLEDSGLTLENGVLCDDRLFAADGVVAAGDVARWMWRHDGDRGADPDRTLAGGRGGRDGGGPRPPGRPAPRRRRSLPSRTSGPISSASASRSSGIPVGRTRSRSSSGSFEEGKFVALFERAGRLRAVMAIGRPRQLDGIPPAPRRRAAAGTPRWRTRPRRGGLRT